MQSDAASSSDGVPGGTLSKSDATSVRGATKVRLMFVEKIEDL
jgi:hypothetical protein